MAPASIFTLKSSGFSDDNACNNFNTDDINTRKSVLNGIKTYSQYAYIGTPSDYSLVPSSITNPCLKRFIDDNTNITIKSATHKLSLNSWGSFTSLFPKSFALLYIEQHSQSNSISFKIKNTFTIPYTIDNFSIVMLGLTTNDTTKIACSYSIYDKDEKLVGQQNNLTFPLSSLNASLTNVSVTIPPNGGFISIDGSSSVKLNNNVYMFVSLENIVYSTPKLLFAEDSISNDFESDSNKIKINAQQNLNKDSLTSSNVTFSITKPSDISFLPLTSIVNFTQTNDQKSTGKVTASVVDSSIYKKLIVGIYNVNASFTESGNYVSMNSLKPLSYTVNKKPLEATLDIIEGFMMGIKTVNNLYYVNGNNTKLRYTFNTNNHIVGTIVFNIKEKGSDKIIQSYTSNNESFTTYTFYLVPVNLLDSKMEPGKKYTITTDFTLKNQDQNYTNPTQKTIDFEIYDIKLSLSFKNSSYQYSKNVEFEVSTYSNNRLFTEFLEYLQNTSVDILINNNKKLTVEFNTATMSYYYNSVLPLDVGEYSAVASNVQKNSSYQGSNIPFSSIINSTSSNLVITSLPTTLIFEESPYSSAFNVPLTIKATYTGIPNNTITGFKLLNSSNTEISNTNYVISTFSEKSINLKLKPSDIGVDSNGNPFSFTLQWSDPIQNYTNCSSNFSIIGSKDTIQVKLTCDQKDDSLTIESPLTFQFEILSSTDMSEDGTLPSGVLRGNLDLYCNEVKLKTIILSNDDKKATININPYKDISGISPKLYSFYVTYIGSNDRDYVQVTTIDSRIELHLSKALTVSTLTLSRKDNTTTSISLNDIIKLSSNTVSTLNNIIPGKASLNNNSIGMTYNDHNYIYETAYFTPLEKQFSVGEFVFTFTFTPDDSANYSSSSTTLTVSLLDLSISFSTLSISEVTYLQNIFLNVAITPFKNAEGNYLQLIGKLTVNSVEYPDFIYFRDENQQAIDLKYTAKNFGLNVGDRTLTVKFTPTNNYINSVQKDVTISIKPQQVSLTVVSDKTKLNYYFNDTVNTIVNVDRINNSDVNISGKIRLFFKDSNNNEFQITNPLEPLLISNSNTVSSTYYKNIVDSKITYTISATFESTDDNYSSTLTSLKTDQITYILEPVLIKTLFINGTNIKDLVEVNKELNADIDIEGTLVDSNGNPVYEGNVKLNNISSRVDGLGKFKFTVSNIYENGFYVLSYSKDKNYEPVSFDTDHLGNTNGEFYVNIDKLDYNLTFTKTDNGFTDYVDGEFTFTTHLDIGSNVIKSDILSNMDQEDGKFTISIYTIEENGDNLNAINPVVFSLKDSNVILTSNTTEFVYKFNPKQIGLDAGSYYVSCVFSGILRNLNPFSTQLDLIINQTTPTFNTMISLQEYYTEFNVNNNPLSSKNSDSITQFMYKQTPFLSIKLASPQTVNKTYQTYFGANTDIDGEATVEFKKSLNGVNLTLINNVDIAYNNGNVLTHGIYSDSKLSYLINTKILRIPQVDAGSYTITFSFKPNNSKNYTEKTHTLNFVVNKYKPIISKNQLLVLTKDNTEVKKNSDGNYNDPNYNGIGQQYLPRNSITYEDPFEIINELETNNIYKNYNVKDTQGTDIDYSNIDGSMAFNYIYSGFHPTVDYAQYFDNTKNYYLINVSDSYMSVSGQSGVLPYTTIPPKGSVKLSILTYTTVAFDIYIQGILQYQRKWGINDHEYDYIVNRMSAFNYTDSILPSSSSNIYTDILLNNSLYTQTSYENKSKWVSIVQNNVFDRKTDVDNFDYTLYLQMIPSDTINYLNSDKQSINLYVYKASVLGSYIFKNKNIPKDFSWSVGFYIEGTLTFDNTINLSYTTGTFKFTYKSDGNDVDIYDDENDDDPEQNIIPYIKVDKISKIIQDFKYKIVSSTSIVARKDSYKISGVFKDDNSNNYHTINGPNFEIICDPTLTISCTKNNILYKKSTIISANLASGTTYSGGLVKFTFKDSSNTEVSTYSMEFTNNVAQFDISLVNDLVKTSETVTSLLLANNTYTVSCHASFSDDKFRAVDQQSTFNLSISKLKVGFTNISVDQNSYVYKTFKPTFTANLSENVYGGSIKWTVKNVAGTVLKQYTQLLTNERIEDLTKNPQVLGPSKTYTYQLIDDLNVDTYSISALYSSDNFETDPLSTNFVVIKDNITVTDLETFYLNPTTLSASLSDKTITDGNVIFTIIETDVSFTASYNNSSYKTPVLSLNPGSYEMIVYYSGNSNYNKSSPSYINIFVNKTQKSEKFKVTFDYNIGIPQTASQTPLKFNYTLFAEVSNSDLYLYSDLQEAYLAKNNNSTFILLDDSLLSYGVNNLYIVAIDSKQVQTSESFKITKPKTKTFLDLQVSTTSTPYNTSITLTSTLTNTRGDTINEGYIVYTINESVVGQSVVLNNVSTIDVKVYTMGLLPITATFVESPKYLSSTQNNSVTVTRTDLTIKLVDKTPTKNFISDIKTINVEVGSQPNTINKGTVNIYNDSILLYSNLDVQNGIASFDLLLQTNYVLSASFSGNDQYNSVESTDSLLISPTKDVITNYYSKATYGFKLSEGFITVKANITPIKSSSLLINSGYIQFILNGYDINVPLVNGVASTNFVATNDTPTATYNNNNYTGSMNA